MKLHGKQVRFLPVRSFFKRNGLNFIGRGNSMQLLETALVIEGNQKTLALYILDILFRTALSEWTTVTIPYSRITRCRYSRHLLGTLGFFALIASPIMVVALVLMLSAGGLGMQEILVLVIAAVVLLIPGWLLFAILGQALGLGPRNTLVYRRADGRLMQVCFRVRPWALQKAFAERLDANRRAAAALVSGPDQTGCGRGTR